MKGLGLALLLSCLAGAPAMAQPVSQPATVTATAVPPAQDWSDDAVRASRIESSGAAALPHRPGWRADPMQLFVVIEEGGPVWLVDGERLEPVHRFSGRPGLLVDQVRFSPDGRHAYLASADGWIGKFDLWNLALVAEVRAGLTLRGIALSSDGRWLMAGNGSPHTLRLFDAGLGLVKSWPAATRDGLRSSPVAAVADAAPRQSFVVALQDIPEVWEISYDPKAEDLYEGLVHDFRMGEGVPVRGFHNARRTMLAEPLGQPSFDAEYTHAVGNAGHAPRAGAATGQVVNLDVRRRIATLPVAGLPQAGSGLTFAWRDTAVLATPRRGDGAIEFVDMRDWQRVATVALPGAGCCLRSHAASRHIWADSMHAATAHDTLTRIDKGTLQVDRQVRQPGLRLGPMELTPDGRHLLAIARDPDRPDGSRDALILYDDQGRAIRRLPMPRPVAVHNVGQRIAQPLTVPR